MKKIELYKYVTTLVDKKFIQPEETIKKGTIGTVLEMMDTDKGLCYLIEFGDSKSLVYEFYESEIDPIVL